MKRTVLIAVRVTTPRIVRGMGARIPAALREIEAARIGERAVDDDDLLVMTRADRVPGASASAGDLSPLAAVRYILLP